MNSRKYDLTVLGLTIMPTSRCNLSCKYCYEKKYDNTMDEKTKDYLLKFAEERMVLAKYLDITWYGGEPLLELNTIVDLSNRLIELSKRYNAAYSAGIITNGTLLTKDVAKILRDQCKVSYCQVTLDGPAEIHDQRRVFSDGRASFITILNNIKDVSDIIDVNIRINVDSENEERIPELLNILANEGIKDKVKMHIGLTEPIGVKSQCSDIISKCLDDEKLPELQIKFYKDSKEKGFSPQFYLIPANVFGLCSAEIVNSYVIEPNGDIQKCWVTVGDTKERIGTVFEGISASANTQKWIGFDPLDIEECRTCKVLPLCWGNCVYRSSRKVDGHHCGMWKYNLENVLSRIDELSPKVTSKQKDREDYSGMFSLRPTFKVGMQSKESFPKIPEGDLKWIYEGTTSKKRCCFIVCVRCTPLEGGCNFGDCKPVTVKT
jgi:uncharacterized protein